MKPCQIHRSLIFTAAFAALALAAKAQAPLPGADVPSLLAVARERNPEYASMLQEAQAARERVTPAGAFPDPRFRVELMDITKGGEQNPNLWPSNVGGTKYTLTQELPWFGKRDLKREIATFDAEGVQGKALGTWSELATKIKIAQAQRHFLHGNRKLTLEILDLMSRLEKIAQVRYANGLAAQQDVVRAQTEQTNMRSELVTLEAESRQVNARLNALLARPAQSPLAEPSLARPWPAQAQLELTTLEERVRTRNPQLFAEDARIKSAEKGRELAYKNRIPDFMVGIQPTQYQTSFKEWTLMLEVNIPLQQESRRAQERESEAMLASARSRKEAVANQVLSDLSENLAGIDAARRIEILATTSLLPQAELTFNSALASYENTKVDFATLLDAQRAIRQARQNQIKARFEGQVRLAEIEKLLGEDL
jgi:cobalt-zinc-cadmium efflux system outer membrane protein